MARVARESDAGPAAVKPVSPGIKGVEYWPLSKLRPFERNARQHTQAQLDQLARSIEEWGWTIPVLIDEHGMILAGHGRVLAARQLGLIEVPVIIARGWTDEQKRGYLIADNKLQENSRWDDALLGIELETLGEGGFDLSLIGLTEKDLKRLVGGDDKPLMVREIATTPVADEFWISVRGPLKHQADALQRLQAMMRDLEGVAVELGTVGIEN